ncbi:cysteine-rich CWC family protein [Chitinivorax sp. PXF-14]|uniref:cysteine-rich CWC family protein n=1 Tax=Chitinivorax sp. PXF-14 TaxID=3230488 RepID=UPI00346577AC
MTPKPNSTCPLCYGPNQCAPARSGSFDTPCWCTDALIDPLALALVPDAQRGEACLCPRCAAGDRVPGHRAPDKHTAGLPPAPTVAK